MCRTYHPQIHYLTDPPVDCGDYVVVTNARQIKVTGKKDEQIVYRKHTMYPGGLKETRYRDMLDKKPDQVRSRLSSVLNAYLTVFIDYSTGSLRYVA